MARARARARARRFIMWLGLGLGLVSLRFIMWHPGPKVNTGPFGTSLWCH